MVSRHGLIPWIRLHLERQRALVLLAVVGAGLLIGALERWRPDTVEPFRHRVFVILEAYLRPMRGFSASGQRSGHRVADLWGVETELEDLRDRLIRTENELQITRGKLRRLERISGLQQWKMPDELEVVAADVIGYQTEDQGAEWIISAGSDDGLEVGMPVVGLRGLAGVIREVSARTARVQALTDPLSAVGVADAESRDRGIVFGRGRDSNLEFIPENENQPLRPGARLETSGFDNSVYPKGLVVGTLVGRQFNDRSEVIGLVEPAENFNALEEVLVVRLARSDRTDAAEGLGSYTVGMPAPAEAGVTTATLSVRPFVEEGPTP